MMSIYGSNRHPQYQMPKRPDLVKAEYYKQHMANERNRTRLEYLQGLGQLAEGLDSQVGGPIESTRKAKTAYDAWRGGSGAAGVATNAGVGPASSLPAGAPAVPGIEALANQGLAVTAQGAGTAGALAAPASTATGTAAAGGLATGAGTGAAAGGSAMGAVGAALGPVGWAALAAAAAYSLLNWE